MIVFHAPEEVPADFGPAVVAIGKFDGVHAGHRALIGMLREKSAALGAGTRSVVVTFDRHPMSLLAPEKCPAALTDVPQKLQLLAETGIDAALVLRFDAERAAQEPRAFVESVLVEHLHAKVVLVGRDFRYGRGGAGDVALLHTLGAEFGFEVTVIDDVQNLSVARRVSSTWVREVLAEGDVEAARELLGRPTSLRGEVVHGLKRGRELGFPTANLEPVPVGVIPADGVYAGWLVDYGPRVAEGSADIGTASEAAPDTAPDTAPEGPAPRRYPAAISIGNNPTFVDVPVHQVEAHILDESGLDLYGHLVDVQFVGRIRGMVAYEGVEPLIRQIADDVERAREMLGNANSLSH